MSTTYTPTPDDILIAYAKGEMVTLTHHVMRDQAPSVSHAFLIHAEGDTVWYTTDGMWYTRSTRGEYFDFVIGAYVTTAERLIEREAGRTFVVEFDSGVFVATPDDMRGELDMLAPGESMTIHAASNTTDLARELSESRPWEHRS